ncbi:MAG: glycosyltransferase [Thermodesulfobacteriota bacterium]|nr:glycosyltransferase [Thermodesulfobacteriota bacterium]
MKNRILEITYHGGTGGVAVLLLNLAKHLKEDFDIEVCFANSLGPVAEDIKSLGVKTYCLNLKSGFDLIGALRLKRFLERKRYDLVHLHYLTPLIRLGVFISHPRATIMTEHGGVKGEKERNRWFLTKHIHRLLRNTVDLYTTVSEENRQVMVNNGICCDEKCLVIYNGIDLDEFHPYGADTVAIKRKLGIPLRKVIVGTVRGLTPKMGIDHFLLALREVLRKNGNVFGVIVGDGPLREELERLAESLGIREDLSFLGTQRNIPELLSLFDIFVMPSVWETFGIAAAEAMATEIPVVAYLDAGGLSELIGEENTGKLVADRDPRLLAESILELIQQPEERRAIGKRARKRISTYFDMKKISQEYKEIYEKTIRVAQ